MVSTNHASSNSALKFKYFCVQFPVDWVQLRVSVAYFPSVHTTISTRKKQAKIFKISPLSLALTFQAASHQAGSTKMTKQTRRVSRKIIGARTATLGKCSLIRMSKFAWKIESACHPYAAVVNSDSLCPPRTFREKIIGTGWILDL